jgi:hypothetical protein
MRSYFCTCGARLFNDNVQCIACGAELGHCPACLNLGPLVAMESGGFQCGRAECGAAILKCANYVEHQVCNRCLTVETDLGDGLCDCCQHNTTIPDLSVEGNLAKWAELESAKRRLFYDLRLLGLPIGTVSNSIEPKLTFAFKEDSISAQDKWRAFRKTEQVYTSHGDGLITINIKEADPVEREKMRVNFAEPHRTIIGHFRHEVGHYYWDVLIKGKQEEAFIALFGNHESPSYSEALANYYQNGPAADWRDSYISAYATMHPWEDFADLFAAYLDLTSTLETAAQGDFPGELSPAQGDLDSMVLQLAQLTISLNEINRNQGLPDVIPEVYVPKVVEKLRYIHGLVQACQLQPVA